eukprot:GHUV01036506.1.p1 GENE.GHUV01036506.1~~GHUV01036506.1.p1  ORF type:complete len:119 (-),score=27.01 GHUV01036506.1:371-727(-)
MLLQLCIGCSDCMLLVVTLQLKVLYCCSKAGFPFFLCCCIQDILNCFHNRLACNAWSITQQLNGAQLGVVEVFLLSGSLSTLAPAQHLFLQTLNGITLAGDAGTCAATCPNKLLLTTV